MTKGKGLAKFSFHHTSPSRFRTNNMFAVHLPQQVSARSTRIMKLGYKHGGLRKSAEGKPCHFTISWSLAPKEDAKNAKPPTQCCCFENDFSNR